MVLCPRMKFGVHFFQSRLVNMRIDLRCRDTGMAEHLLDLTQIGTTSQQMSRETVSHCVRADGDVDIGKQGELFDKLPDRLTTQLFPAA